MTIEIADLVDDLVVESTILILGAGASVSSDAPSVGKLIQAISAKFGIDADGLSLKEIASLVEVRKNRSELVGLIRSMIKGLKAKGALLNIPHYAWKNIFTTNYDELVENSYERAGLPLSVISSNFDFTADSHLGATKLFKLHGTIQKDTVDGHVSRMIITETDYDHTNDYREALYDRLKSDMNPGSQVLIVGQSLADSDLRELVQRAITINQNSQQKGVISLLLYDRDENRAQLFESRGIRVAFGSLDDFVSALGRRGPTHKVVWDDDSDPLDVVVDLRPVTFLVSEEVDPSRANASAIFNGWPANYPEIVKGLTFDRTVANEVLAFLQDESKICVVLLGASGVGKTTAARQTVLKLRGQG